MKPKKPPNLILNYQMFYHLQEEAHLYPCLQAMQKPHQHLTQPQIIFPLLEALDLISLSIESKVKASVTALHKVHNFKGLTLPFWCCFFNFFWIIFHSFKFNCNLVWYWNQWQYCSTKRKGSLNRWVEALTPMEWRSPWTNSMYCARNDDEEFPMIFLKAPPC